MPVATYTTFIESINMSQHLEERLHEERLQQIRQQIEEEEGKSFLSSLFGFGERRYTPHPVLFMYYVITPDYVPDSEAVDACVFLTKDKYNAVRVLDYLNSTDNAIVKHIHNIAKDTVDHEPVNPKFVIRRFGPNYIRAKTTIPVSKFQLDFLLLDGLLNQDIDKVAASNQNQTLFDTNLLDALRKHFADKHFV